MTFTETETEFRQLKTQYDAGDLSETDFKARLQDLMIQDEQGRWWMIGYETGQWYVHDGEKWAQGEPPPVAERHRKQTEDLCQEGKTALEAGDWMAAVEKFEAALGLTPDHAEALQRLAEAKARAGEASQPEAPVQFESSPAASVKRQWVWVVAGIIGIIGVILVIIFLRSSTTPEPRPNPEARLWADRDTIRPEACTWLHWNVPGAERVRIVGPGFDPESLLSGSGEREVCLQETTVFRLLTPDGQGIETMVIYVR